MECNKDRNGYVYGANMVLKVNGVSEEDGLVHIEGYANHYGKPNHNGELITKTAYDSFMKEMAENGVMPAMTFNHNGNMVIGGWDEISSDDETGLYVKGHINTNSWLAREYVMPLIKSGDLKFMSTEHFLSLNDCMIDASGIMKVGKAALVAISLVSVPADFGAKVSANYLLKRDETPDHEDTEERGTFTDNPLKLFI